MQGRQQYVGEQDQMLQNAGGLMRGASPQDLQFGSYAQQGVVNSPDYTGNTLKMWEMQQAQENAKAKAKSSSLMGGLGTVAGGIGAGFMSGWNPKAMQAGASIGGSAGGLLDR
jgi:hypothetical protein